MSLRRLRAAAVLGACAVVLTVGVLPANAVDTNDPTGAGSVPVAEPTVTAPDTGTAPSTGTAPDATGATGTGDPTDVGAAGTDSTGSTPSSSPTPTADSTSDTSGTSDSGDILAGGGDSSDSAAGAQAGPIVRLDGSRITAADLSSTGMKVVASGLTPNSRYQPVARLGSSSVAIGPVLTSDVWGWLTFTWKPRSVAAGAWSVGVSARDGQTDGGDQPLTVKYDAALTWHRAKRHGGSIVLTVEADRSFAAGRSAPWKGAKVLLQKRSGGTWRTVRTVTADRKGIARATIVASTATWRAKVAETPTVFGVSTGSHRK